MHHVLVVNSYPDLPPTPSLSETVSTHAKICPSERLVTNYGEVATKREGRGGKLSFNPTKGGGGGSLSHAEGAEKVLG